MLILLWGFFSEKIIAVNFYDLGSLSGAGNLEPYSVNSTGSVVVGASSTNYVSQAFRWTQANGIQFLGVLSGRSNSVAYGVSGDGAVVVGYSFGSSTLVSRAFRWSQSNGIQSIGTFSGGTDTNSTSYATDVSADSTYVVGTARDVPNVSWRAFRWTQTGGMQNLGNLPGSSYWWNSFATGISYDGSVVVGNVQVTQNGALHAFRWTQSAGMQDLGSFNAGDESFANGVSADGATVVGYNQANEYVVNRYDTRRAFRWTQAGGMQDLGVLEGATTSEARSVNSDGSIVVGTSGGKAFIWSQGTGMVDLTAYLANLLPETTLFSLQEVTDISSDGNTLVGKSNFSGSYRAFVVTDLGNPLSTSVNNSEYGTISAGGFKIVGSVQTVEASANPGFVFTGWSGDASGSLNPISVTMNSSKAIIANFAPDLSDNDADGLSNHDEIIIHSSNPNQADSNLDGLTDSQAVGLGYSPVFNFGPLLGFLRTNNTSANSFGLYATNQIMDLKFGGMVLSRTNNQLSLTYEILQSSNLVSWTTNRQETVTISNPPASKMFLRITPKQ